jgi:predicted nucleic acid-binding protein
MKINIIFSKKELLLYLKGMLKKTKTHTLSIYYYREMIDEFQSKTAYLKNEKKIRFLLNCFLVETHTLSIYYYREMIDEL